LYLLLEHFRANPGIWIAMPELAEVCGSYVVHSKVATLRRDGLGCFENEMEADERDGQRVNRSFYRYTPAP
jgi:hypothetical protein